MRIPAIDHIGVVGAKLDHLVQDFARLGFTVAPRCELVAIDADGQENLLGQSNSHLIFDNAYVELTAVEGDVKNHHLAAEIARYYGLHILVLLSENADQDRAELIRRGFEIGDIANAGRDVRYPGNTGAARFRWFRVPKERVPEAFVCFVEHLNRDLVFDCGLNTHANGARSFCGVRICVADLEASAARLAAVLGTEPESRGEQLVFHLPVGEITLQSSESLLAIFPDVDPKPVPWVAGFSVITEDLADTRRHLSGAGVSFSDEKFRIWVGPEETGGTLVEFVERAGRNQDS